MASTIQNQVANTTKATGNTMISLVKSMEGEFAKALPSVMTPERFVRIATTALSTTPGLAKCTPKSFVGALLCAAQLGLEPNTQLGQAYLIPYKNKGVDEVQFQIGYKGLIDLAYRSGEVETIQAQIVYENDHFECQYGLEPKLTHIPADSNRGKIVKAYALFKTKSGGFGFEVMSVEDLENHAKKYSKSSGSAYSPWTTNKEEMYKKTVLKKALKYAPIKSDFARGVAQDESIKSSISDDMYCVANEVVAESDYQEVTVDGDTETTSA